MPHAAAPGTLLAAALADEAVRARAREILSRRGYQTELPAAPASWDLQLGWLDLVVRALFWTAVAVGALLVVTWLWRQLASRTRDVAAPAEPAHPTELASRPMLAAEALAAERRYGEAIHALLLLTLEALSRGARLPPSLTSREVLARVPMPIPARDALGGLVAAVEVSWFGGAEPGDGEYRSCLGRFHAFVEAYRRAA